MSDVHVQDLFDLGGRVAIVTGGNGGLGKGMALVLSEAGAKVVIAARDEGKSDAALQELGADPMSVTTDVASEEDVSSMVRRCIEVYERVDILVNNAGTNIRRSPQDYSIDEWDHVLDVNLRGAFLCSREVYPHMKAVGGGKIINVGSMAALFGSDVVAPYAASKGGMVQLSKSLAIAWAKDNIQVNAVLPGWFDTALTSPIAKHDPDRHSRISDRIPASRWGAPQDLQGVTLLLASRASDYITGAVISVDGGYSAMG